MANQKRTLDEALDLLWDEAMSALEAILCQPAEDADRAKRSLSSDKLGEWVDELEERLDVDAGDLRALVLDFRIVRDGPGNCPDLAKYRAELLSDLEVG